MADSINVSWALPAITGCRVGGSSTVADPAGFPARVLPPTVAEAFDQPPIPFGRPPGGVITHQARSRQGGRRGRRAAVEIALGRPRRSDPLIDYLHDLQHPVPAIQPDGHDVTSSDRRRRLGDGAVDRHMSGPACLRGDGTGLEHPDRPQPPIDPRAIHEIGRNRCRTAWPEELPDARARSPRRTSRSSHRSRR